MTMDRLITAGVIVALVALYGILAPYVLIEAHLIGQRPM